MRIHWYHRGHRGLEEQPERTQRECDFGLWIFDCGMNANTWYHRGHRGLEEQPARIQRECGFGLWIFDCGMNANTVHTEATKKVIGISRLMVLLEEVSKAPEGIQAKLEQGVLGSTNGDANMAIISFMS